MFPLDKRWPFLLRVPATIFGMSMGISNQSIVWKGLATQTSMAFLRVPDTVSTVIWFIGIVALFASSVVYALKICFWPKVRTLLSNSQNRNLLKLVYLSYSPVAPVAGCVPGVRASSALKFPRPTISFGLVSPHCSTKVRERR